MSINYTCVGCNQKFYGKPLEMTSVFMGVRYMGQREYEKINGQFCSKVCKINENKKLENNNLEILLDWTAGQIKLCKDAYAKSLAIADYEDGKRLVVNLKFLNSCKNLLLKKITPQKYKDIVNDVIEFATEHKDDKFLSVVCCTMAQMDVAGYT